MTPDSIAATLLSAGLDPAEVPGRIRLFDSAAHALIELADARPAHVWWVPGRLEVFGTHTDYAGGRSLVSAVPRGFILAAARRADNLLRVIDARRGGDVVVETRSKRFVFDGWRHYIEVVVERLARNFPGAALGADIAFASDLPRASGMSSSSALVVGIAVALVELAGLRDRPEWQASIHDSLQEATYYSCLENGHSFGPLTGDAGVGTHGGSEDHAAMLCSAPGALTHFRFMPMARLDVVAVPEGWQFVICSSGVTAEKTGAAREAYNRLAASAAALRDLSNAVGPPAASLGAILDSEHSLYRLRELVQGSRRADRPAGILERRLEHFIAENTRVTAALRAFRTRDVTGIRDLAASSQRDAEDLLENQIEATVILTRAALDEGALAARSFGAGFGGSVWALVNRGQADDFAARWLARYRTHRASNASAAAFAVTSAPAVVELGG